MYEAYFGLNGRPFQLNPDPSFFYGSRGHSSAYSYLKFGAYQGEGFIVVTGEIGAGKTTLVRALLRELDPQKVVAAQLVSTQLDENELLRSIAAAFGLTIKAASKAELIATLEAFFTLLVGRKRRALLVVDEAQNLSPSALEELRLLSNFQIGEDPLLQSFLVGQPELRDALRAPNMEQLRQRVIASYHLGPMDEGETAGYIEHRLRHVGWTGDPSFAPDVYGLIHAWAGGLPRKINLLANRLMLSAFLAERHAIHAADVKTVIAELRHEMGQSTPVDPTLVESPLPSTQSVVPPAPVVAPPIADEPPRAAPSNVVELEPNRVLVVPTPLGVHESAGDAARPARRSGSGFTRSEDLAASAETGWMLCVLDVRSSYMKFAPLLRAFARHAALPRAALVQVEQSLDYALSDQLRADLDLPVPEANLEISGGSPVARMAETMRRFEQLLEEVDPKAVLVAGHSDAALACALVATRTKTPVVRLDAGQRNRHPESIDERNRTLLDRLGTVLYACGKHEIEHLHHEGFPTDRVHAVGNLMVDALIEHRHLAVPPQETLRAAGVAPEVLRLDKGYALLVVHQEANVATRDALTNVLLALRSVGVHVPTLWPMDPHTRAKIDQFGVGRTLDDLRIASLPPQGYLEIIGLLAHARVVLTDSGSIQDEATVLGVPCLTLGGVTDRVASVESGNNLPIEFDSAKVGKAIKSILKDTGKRGALPDDWDGHTAERIAAHLADWFHRQHGNAAAERVRA